MISGKFLSLAVYAASSSAITLAIISPPAIHADGPQDQPGLYLAPTPKLVNGVTYILEVPDKAITNGMAVIQPSKKLPFRLIVINRLQESVEISPTVAISSFPPVSFLSRTRPRSNEVWRTSDTVTLGPKEERSFSFSPEIEQLPASSIDIQVHVGGNSIAKMQLAVAGDPPKIPSGFRPTRPSPATRPAVAQSGSDAAPSGIVLGNQ